MSLLTSHIVKAVIGGLLVIGLISWVDYSFTEVEAAKLRTVCAKTSYDKSNSLYCVQPIYAAR
jgi:hypothetical protein